MQPGNWLLIRRIVRCPSGPTSLSSHTQIGFVSQDGGKHNDSALTTTIVLLCARNNGDSRRVDHGRFFPIWARLYFTNNYPCIALHCSESLETNIAGQLDKFQLPAYIDSMSTVDDLPGDEKLGFDSRRDRSFFSDLTEAGGGVPEIWPHGDCQEVVS